ncbi:4a-hydroxytetrahydrobiopterin dehydratase [bacterium]|nr:4a-hydroxytetrahydrobiopterin dehydratase [bacterium]
MNQSDDADRGKASNGVDLAAKKCVPCEGGAFPLTRDEAEKLLKDTPAWMLWPDASTISRSLKFKNFKDAFACATKIAALAEEEGHHPDLLISWGRVEIELSTHAIGGLSENDFILAAKIDKIT